MKARSGYHRKEEEHGRPNLCNGIAIKLAQTGDVGEGLTLILETVVKALGMESGGIWLRSVEEKIWSLFPQ